MHILGMFERPKSTEPVGSQKPFFGDLGRPRRDELDQAILSGKAPLWTAEFRHETEYKLGSLLMRAGL